MKTIIAGSRSITDPDILTQALARVPWLITAVISGTARGADRLGERYARENDLPLHRFPADWQTYGKRAGYLRNVKMAEAAEACVVLWDGQSRGAAIMARIAKRHRLETLVYRRVVGGWTHDYYPAPDPQLELDWMGVDD